MVNIICDDRQGDVQLLLDGGQWSNIPMERFYGGSAVSSSFAATEYGDTGRYARLAVMFQGIQISLFGTTPPARASQTIRVSIDGGAPYWATYGDAFPPSTLQWYQSPKLRDGAHTIEISQIAGASLDYIVIEAGSSTSLSGKRAIVDDNDPAINYWGPWTRRDGPFETGEKPQFATPHGNSTHQSWGRGASARFQFTGTAISVYGVADWSQLGTMEVVYTLDTRVYRHTHSVTTWTQEYRNGVLQRGNTVLFESPEQLAPGSHTLTIEVANTSPDMSFMLDYIVYTPVSNTFDSTPSKTGSSDGRNDGHATPTSESRNTGDSSRRDSTPIGAIVGATAGVIAIFAISLFLFLRRRRKAPCPDASSPPSYGESQERPSLLAVAPFMAELRTHDGSSTNNEKSPSNAFQRRALRHSARPRPMSLPMPLSKRMSTLGGDRTAMQRFQELVVELNREISDVGGEDSLRIVELRSRISELTKDQELAGDGVWL
ncbi:hypothetical protein H0H81_008670 [Sphagnurus paluster]|uniref:Uncharacterized protein n=1 Tax=Sphagnurus paluster TaxID=117069 RepID=A0A9P7K4U1_9AGAR|nr:hypothetical protein H0H81_008670 [Sphagnurus paluster]